MTCPVQVKSGVGGLYDGAEVVLGPDSGLLGPGPEQQFINQKMRPGSGVLSVQVLPDGPTRVLQVVLVSSEEITVLALFITFFNSVFPDKRLLPAESDPESSQRGAGQEQRRRGAGQ